MSAGMAGVIAAHSWFAVDDDGMMVCWFNDCGWRHGRGGESFALRAAHVAEQLTKAGYGLVRTPAGEALTETADRLLELGRWPATSHPTADRTTVQAALLAAADEMPIETLGGADKASVWLRMRAHSLDPEGHALVKAIHDRKAGA